MIDNLLENNAQWADSVTADKPDFFTESAKGQAPKYLWIGCADSRVPAAKVLGLDPGDIFVHRNIANVVSQNDLNSLSVIQYAVQYLGVTDIIVCGHYGCGGVQAAMSDNQYGLIDNWLRNIKAIIKNRKSELDAISDEQVKFDTMCEFNVMEQVANVGHTTVLESMWKEGREVRVHGLVYALNSGKLKDLEITISNPEELAELDKKINYV